MSQLTTIKPLDGIRALAILLVLISHYFNCQIGDDVTGILKSLKWLTFCTWSGVDLFFILSGFLIGRILIVHKRSQNYFKTFYLRRAFRIFPVYYLIILIFVILMVSGFSPSVPWLMKNPFPLYSYLLCIQNFWASTGDFGPNWLGVTWSLAVEEQFYLLLPLLVIIIKDKWLPFFFT